MLSDQRKPSLFLPMRMVLAFGAALEAATGLALMFAPSVVSMLLFGEGISETGNAVGRVTGIALVSLGVACWPGRQSVVQPAAARAMLTYNPLVTFYLIFLGIDGQRVRSLLWPTVALRGLLTLLLVRGRLRTWRAQRWARTSGNRASDAMTEQRKPGLILPIAVTLAMLLGLYVGAYYAMVRPEFIRFQNMIGASWIVVVPRYGHSDEDGEGIAARVFGPIHWLDRRIRPHVWEPTE